MSFQMKNRYETGEEFYQDIKKHLIEDGFIVAKTDEDDKSEQMEYLKKLTNINETVVSLSDEEDEWYCHYQTCIACSTEFMCSNAKFCPCCGRKIIARRQGNILVYYGKGDKDE